MNVYLFQFETQLQFKKMDGAILTNVEGAK